MKPEQKRLVDYFMKSEEVCTYSGQSASLDFNGNERFPNILKITIQRDGNLFSADKFNVLIKIQNELPAAIPEITHQLKLNMGFNLNCDDEIIQKELEIIALNRVCSWVDFSIQTKEFEKTFNLKMKEILEKKEQEKQQKLIQASANFFSTRQE